MALDGIFAIVHAPTSYSHFVDEGIMFGPIPETIKYYDSVARDLGMN